MRLAPTKRETRFRLTLRETRARHASDERDLEQFRHPPFLPFRHTATLPLLLQTAFRLWSVDLQKPDKPGVSQTPSDIAKMTERLPASFQFLSRMKLNALQKATSSLSRYEAGIASVNFLNRPPHPFLAKYSRFGT